MSTSSTRNACSDNNRSLSCCSAANAPASQPADSACCAPSARTASSSRAKLSFFGNAVLREFALRETMY